MTMRRAADRAIELRGVPDGIKAYPVDDWRKSEGASPEPVRTRRGRLKLDEVELRAEGSSAAPLDPDDLAFVLGARRRQWRTIETRYHADAWSNALRLVRAGHVVLRCTVEPGPRLGKPIGWRLTDTAIRAARARAGTRSDATQAWQSRARSLAASLDGVHPVFFAALRNAVDSPASLPVVVHAAEDYLSGIVHDGPRAFVQQHFGNTKARRDPAAALRRTGVPDDVLVALGLRRSARIGLAGPIDLHIGNHTVPLEKLDGPVLLRTDQADLRIELTRPVALVIVENLQAADAVADRFDDAVVYIAGMPGPAALRLVRALATRATTTFICTDADAGGVRIAEKLLGAVPTAVVLDPGSVPHPPRPRWQSDGSATAELQRALHGRARDLAAACLERGYPVEQEATIIDIVTRALAEFAVTTEARGVDPPITTVGRASELDATSRLEVVTRDLHSGDGIDGERTAAIDDEH